MLGVDEVKRFIEEHGLDARILEFDEPVKTVEEAVRRSGADPSEIVKTMLLIVDDRPIAAIIPGDKRLDLEKVRRVLKAGYVRLAKAGEVKRLLGVSIGAVSPLLSSIRRIKCLMDEEVLGKERIIAGGGSEKTLISIRSKDLADALNPIMADIKQG